MRHRSDVDGLRALAVLPILAYHFGAEWMPGGFTGVDIFFVISGFVIAGSIDTDLRSRAFSIRGFYAKRIRRILPALMVTLFATTALSVVFLLPTDLGNYGLSLASTSAFISNWFFWKTSGYFEAAAQTKPLLHTWSLAVEEQYYLIAPMSFAAISRWGKRRWIWFLAPVAILSLCFSIFVVFAAPKAGFFFLPSRLWELLLGAIIALCSRPTPNQCGFTEAIAVIGLGLILYGLFGLREGEAFPGWNACYPCFGAALLIQSGLGAEDKAALPLINRLLASAPFVWVGRISYSLYLVHWPIAAFHKYLALGSGSAIDFICMFVASLGLAWLSWRLVERPFRRVSSKRWRTLLSAQFAATALGAAAGLSLAHLHGLPERFPKFHEHAIPGMNDWGGAHCFNQDPVHGTPWSAAACTRVHGANGRILLWGDSFAAAYIPGVLRDQPRINADVMQYTFAGCPPILAYFSYARPACTPFNRNALAIIKQYHVDTVVITAKWAYTAKDAIAQLHDTIATLQSMGVRVFLIGQSPMFVMDVQHLDYISGLWRRGGSVDWPVSFDTHINDELRAQAHDATFVDPLSYLCKSTSCTYRNDGDYYYSDFGHFSTSGSLRATRAYFPAGIAPSAEAHPVH